MAIPQNRPSNMQVAPVSGNDAGIRRAEVKQGIREVVACKDGEGKIGLRIRHVNNVWKHFLFVNSDFWCHSSVYIVCGNCVLSQKFNLINCHSQRLWSVVIYYILTVTKAHRMLTDSPLNQLALKNMDKLSC